MTLSKIPLNPPPIRTRHQLQNQHNPDNSHSKEWGEFNEHV
jgi:hypothetical protein